VTNPLDVRYLTGFVGDDSWALVSAASNRVTLISDFRFQEQIAREAPHAAVVIRKGPFSDVLVRIAHRSKIDRFAVQSASMTLAVRNALAAKLSARRLVPVDDGLLQQRAVKDPIEVRLIGRALQCQQEAYRRVLKELKPGQTERSVVARLEMHMRELGADGSSFPTIVAADANTSLPHALAGQTRIKKGGTILFDWGARCAGYCSDLTRVVAIGRMPSRVREIYRIVLDAQCAAIDAIGPGRAMCEVDAVARRWIDKAGYGDQFGHSLGHGIGLHVHEEPVVASRSDGELKPGHVVTVEPGIYLPGVAGVRIEDDVLVTPRGRRVLSDLPKDLESAIV